MIDPRLARTVQIFGQPLECATIEELRMELMGAVEALDQMTDALPVALPLPDQKMNEITYFVNGIERLIAFHDQWVNDWIRYKKRSQSDAEVVALKNAISDLCQTIDSALKGTEN